LKVLRYENEKLSQEVVDLKMQLMTGSLNQTTNNSSSKTKSEALNLK